MQEKLSMTTMNYELNKYWYPQSTKWLLSLLLTICCPLLLLSACGCSIEFFLSHVVLSKTYCNLVSMQHCFGWHLYCGIVCRTKLRKMLPLFVICDFWPYEHLKKSALCDECVVCSSVKWEVFHTQLSLSLLQVTIKSNDLCTFIWDQGVSHNIKEELSVIRL